MKVTCLNVLDQKKVRVELSRMGRNRGVVEGGAG